MSNQPSSASPTITSSATNTTHNTSNHLSPTTPTSSTTNADSTPPLKSVQSVSFGDLENQERTRRFTISSQPSAVNVTNHENSASNQPPQAPQPPASQAPPPPPQQQSSTPSRKTSLSNRKNSASNEALSFLPKSVYQQLQNASPAAATVTTTPAAATSAGPKSLTTINTSMHATTSITSSNSNSNTSLRFTSPDITPTILKTSFSFDSQSHSQQARDHYRPKQVSPSPPPMSPAVEPAKHQSIPLPTTSTTASAIPINISHNGSKSIIDLTNATASGSDSATNSQNPSRKASLKRSSNKTIVASPVGPPVPFQQYLSKEDDGKIHILIACTGSVATIKIPLIIDKFFQIYGNSKISIQLIVTKNASFFLKGAKINKNVKIWRDEDEWGNYIKEFDQQTEPATTTTTSTTNNLSVNTVNNKKKHNPFDKMILHNELRRWADIMLIAPLSANTLAKISNGISDNLLTSIIRSWNPSIKKPILVAPAMNTFMYTHPITAKQLSIISSPDFGIDVLKPVEKVLVCGDIGMGGMREWTDIVEIVKKRISIIKLERKQLEEGIVEDEDDEEEEEEDNEENEDDEDDDEDDEEDDDEEEDEEEDEENNDPKSNDAKNDQDMIFDINEEDEEDDHHHHPQQSHDLKNEDSTESSTTDQVRIPTETQNII